MILWRVLPRDPSAGASQPGGALWFPRAFQGAGRHDNPDRYGCLYLAGEPSIALAETLAPFRGSGDLVPDMLIRSGRPLALAQLALDDTVELLDLDDPGTLLAEGLRPSNVATRQRATTQRYAGRLHAEHPGSGGLLWWSTLEAGWINVTLFDRAAARLHVQEVSDLTVRDPSVVSAAEFLGLRVL